MAGVSTTTVSHVINKTRFVAKETEEAVMQAIKSLKYSPSAVARSLKVNTTKSIGMIVTTSESPYFAEIIHAVEDHCYRQGYSLFLCNTQNDPEKIKNHVEMLAKKRVDGLLVMCSEYTQHSLDVLSGFSSVPMVVMDWGPNPNYYSRFTVAELQPSGIIRTLYYDENEPTDLKTLFDRPKEMNAGHYFLVTGTRMASGSVLCRMRKFTVEAGKTARQPLELLHDSTDIQVIGSINAEQLYHDFSHAEDRSPLYHRTRLLRDGHTRSRSGAYQPCSERFGEGESRLRAVGAQADPPLPRCRRIQALQTGRLPLPARDSRIRTGYSRPQCRHDTGGCEPA